VTFLPLAERELRVAARQPITRRLRVGAALAAMMVAAGFHLVASVGRGGIPPGTFGVALFVTLVSLALGAALMAGPFLTSDCLSEEKREGTLGFLFLTDLRGHDVVLGKLASTSVRSGFALLALFPIVGVTLLFGGVTGAQFFKSALTLLSTLAVSLSAGMLSSALSRQPQKSMALTLLVLAVLTGGGLLADKWLGGSGGLVFFRILSPAYLMICAQGWVPGPFWTGWFIQIALAALLLWTSSQILPHVWQDRAKQTAPGSEAASKALKTSRPVTPHRWRTRWLDENPALWLAVRERWMVWILWGLAAGMGTATVGFGIACWPAVTGPGNAAWEMMLTMVWNLVSAMAIWVLFLSAATQSVRFFVDARRSGLLELLLATPLSDRDIVSGHWRGWRRAYGLPVFLCLTLAAVSSWALQSLQFRQITTPIPIPATAMPTAPPGVTQAPGLVSTNGTVVSIQLGTGVQTSGIAPGISVPTVLPVLPQWLPLATAVLHWGSTALSLMAVGWMGMWMGLTSRGVIVAALKTLVFVQVIPWFVIAFLAALTLPLFVFPMLMNSSGTGAGSRLQSWMLWAPLLSHGISFLLSVGKDLALIFWARDRLYSQFRFRALPVLTPVLLPPLPQPPAGIPPVIGR